MTPEPVATRSAPSPPPAAHTVFGARLGLAEQYADLLCGPGVDRGLLGPREADRVWDRHLLNCAVLGSLVEPDCSVLDVGSGAGLPGIALALARPDLTVILLESMARRVAFLEDVVQTLSLSGVRVVRGRAEDVGVRRGLGRSPVVTARAVAPLTRLAHWCRPLVARGGSVLAVKGDSAAAEVAAGEAEVRRLGFDRVEVVRCGEGLVEPAATVIRMTVAP